MADDMQSNRAKLWGMIKEYKFAMMTTRQPDDVLRSRPMTTIEHDADDSLWFFAKSDSTVAESLSRFPQVCLSYSDASDHDYVSVSGEAVLVTDVAKKKALWNKMVQAWFPEGPTASSVVLIRVSPDHAEYWDSNSSKVMQLFSMAKALATGVPPRELGEHRDVPVSRNN